MAQYGGPQSVIIPAATQGLQVRFSRTRDSFAVNRCLDVVPVTAIQGKFLRLDPDAGARIRTARSNWPDGQFRPAPFASKHEWADFSCERSSENWQTGNLTLDQAMNVTGWDKAQTDMDLAATLAMLNLTYEFETLVTDVATISKADCATAVGGVLLGSSEANGYIQEAITYGVNQIITATRGAVKRSDIQVLMGVTLAEAISESPEYKSYAKNWANAQGFAERKNPYDEYGLLPSLWGVQPVVFPDVFVTSAEGASVTTRRAFSGLGTSSGFDIDDPLIFQIKPKGPMVRETAEVGAQDGVPRVGGSLHGGVLKIVKEDMVSEVDVDNWHRITRGGVSNNYDLVVSSTRSIYMIGECVA